MRTHRNKLSEAMVQRFVSDRTQWGKFQKLLEFRKEAKATLLILGKQDLIRYHGYNDINAFFEAFDDGTAEIGNYRLPKWLVKKIFPGWKPLVRSHITNQGQFAELMVHGTRQRMNMQSARREMKTPKTLRLVHTVQGFSVSDATKESSEKSVEILLTIPEHRLSMIKAQQTWIAKYATKFISASLIRYSQRWTHPRIIISLVQGKINVVTEFDDSDHKAKGDYDFLKQVNKT